MRTLLLFVCALPALADTGNAVCARCHAAIARQYAQTGMAQSSGRVGQSPFKENLTDPRVSPAFLLQLGETSRQLEYFIGSGHIGRSYLFRRAGLLFQAPLSYFSAPKEWNTSPGFQHKPYPEFTRAVEPACLQCHTSPSRPFADSGVTCERCHGPGERHAARPAKSNIVNPAKLAPEQRDSVCAQCHLTGVARFARANRERGAYQPGDKLSDSIAIFVLQDPALSATSHMEKLAASRCQLATGNKLWCGTCHTAHADSTPEYYKSKCQGCHQPGSCTANAGNDCVGCHMPKRPTHSLEHLAFTDHSIPRRPSIGAATANHGKIKEFWTGQANERDTAMAHSITNLDDAYQLLQESVKINPKDLPLQLQLAQQHERYAQDGKAQTLYTEILQSDPANTTALINLGTLRIKAGKAKEAMALWLRALAKNPALIGARLNLAVAQYQSGDPASAKASLKAVLEFEPAHPAALRMLAQLP